MSRNFSQSETMNLETLIPLIATAIIGVATLAAIPIIKALGELKRGQDEIHKQVNSNLTTQTTELKAANERIAILIASSAESDKRVADMLLLLNRVPQIAQITQATQDSQPAKVEVVNPEPVKVKLT